MILPADFDSTKKYKALVYVYGGPGVQLITNEWLGGAGLWLNYMAAHGYVIFTIDSRGSANRGLAEPLLCRYSNNITMCSHIIKPQSCTAKPFICYQLYTRPAIHINQRLVFFCRIKIRRKTYILQ